MSQLTIGCILGTCAAVAMTAPTADAQTLDFARVTGFGPIALTGTLATTQTALGKARIPHDFKVFHKTGVPYITLRTGWAAPAMAGGSSSTTVYFNRDERLTEVLVRSPDFKSEVEAKKQLAQIVGRYGKPARAKPEGPGQRHWEYEWRNRTTVLRVSLVSNKRETDWVVTQSWVPAVKPPTRPVRGPAIDGSRINAPPKPLGR